MYVVALISSLFACNGEMPTLPGTSGTPGTPGTTTAPDGTPAAPVDALGLHIRAVGPDRVGPTRILVHVRPDFFEAGYVGGLPPEGTEIAIVPEVVGEWTVSASDALSFAPKEGLRPDTAYQVVVKHVGDGRAVHDPVGHAWTHAFKTPPFQFARLGLVQHDADDGELTVDVLFTAAVDSKDAAKSLSFTFQDAPVKPVRIVAGDDPWELRATFKGKQFREAGVLAIDVAAGVPYTFDKQIVAPAAHGDLPVRPGAPITIHAAKLREGGSGFYVDVICSDASVPTTRYFWDDVDYTDYNVTTRCQLSDQEARQAVHFDPEAAVSVASAPGGFRIFAPLERGTYKLRIDAGAVSVDGGVLNDAFETELEVKARKPTVAFATQGRYLPRTAWTELPVRHRNVDLADVEIRHVPDANLIYWMTASEDRPDNRTSDLVAKQQIHLAGKDDEDTTTWVDVRSLVNAPERGVYEVRIRAKAKPEEKVEDNDTGWRPEPEVTDDGYRVVAETAAQLLLTDMHLIAKLSTPEPGRKAPSQVTAWTIGVVDNAPVSGAELRLVRASGKTVGTCTTDAAGGCSIDVPAMTLGEEPPVALIARKGDDLTFVEFEDLRVQAETDVTGAAWTTDTPYRAAVISDRGVYRPGDTAHLVAIVRDRAHGAPAARLPVVLHLIDPQGKLNKKIVLATNDAGLVSADVPFADFARTGRWRARFDVADKSVGQVPFSVEEFVPERMRVTASADRPEGGSASEPTALTVEARWLFGASADGSKIEVQCHAEAGSFAPAGREAFAFGLADVDAQGHTSMTLGTITGVIGADDKAQLACPPPAHGAGVSGPVDVIADVAVFEGDSGRTTSAHVKVPAHPEKYYLGLQAPRGKLATTGPTSVSGIVVGWDGKTAATKPKTVSLEFQRLETEYGWMWDADGGSDYRRMTRRSREDGEDVTVAADGSFSASFSPSDASSDYLVIATAGNARTELLIQGAGWYSRWSSSEDQTPRPDRPDAVRIETPTDLRVGETATAKFVSPWAGRALMAVETDHVVSSEWIDVPEGAATWSFSLPEFAPNAYVTALIVKDPRGETSGAWLPDRAFGATSVRTIPEAYVHDVKITAPAEVKPYDHFEVALDLGPQDGPTYATVAAVDEGILSLTKFADPDPSAQIFEKRRLGVDSFETVGWTLAMPPGGPSSRTGGDDEETSGGRVQGVRPVALWSGVLSVPADGKLKVGFDVPSYRGSLRVMAVTAGKVRTGHAATSVAVRDPLSLTTTLPRFLTGDDTAKIPVGITNLSGRDREVTVTIQATELPDGDPAALAGPKPGDVISFPAGNERKVHIGVGATETVVFDLTVGRAPAGVGLRVTAKSGELESKEELALPIMPSQPEVRRVTRYALDNGALDVTPHLAEWLAGTERTTLWVTTNPYAPALAHLPALVRYPHGCIEQTTSATRPLLYAGALLADIAPETLEKNNVDAMVASGIERVIGMQTASGGFAYWPGGSSADPWGTAYATHMLIDAKAAKHAVPQRALDDAIGWLSRDADKQAPDMAPDHARAYAQYVLAVAGKGRPALARSMLTALEKDPRNLLGEDRYLLMAAIYKSGDRRYEDALKKPDASPVRDDRWWNRSYGSDLRSRGVMLSTYYDLFGRDADGEALADVLSTALGTQPSSQYYTTQEMAWGVTALGKWVGKPAPLTSSGVSIDGASAKPLTSKSGNGTSYRFKSGSLAGNVSVSAAAAGPVWVVETIQGVRKVNDAAYGGVGLFVKRELLDVSGRPIGLGSIPLGQAAFVRLTVTNTSGRDLDDVALTDRLPAGFEIENARLGRGALPDWASEDSTWTPDYLDLRDDRVQVYGALSRGSEAEVVYAVRAVTAGSFTWPDVGAESMYDPKTWSRARPESIKIVGPW